MDTIPGELLLHIFEIVSEQLWHGKWLWNTMYRTRNLQRLSLVSRRFNRIVTPMLYERIRGPFFRDTPFWEQIADTLYRNHDLAQLIESFSMTRCPPGVAAGNPGDMRSKSLLPLLPLLSCFDSLAVHKLILDLEHRSRRGDSVLATFLVLQAPALVKIELAGFENDGSHVPKRLPLVIEEMGRMIIKDLDAGRTPQCFRSLRSLHMDLWDWGYFPPSAVVPFMYLKQLKQLILKGWGFQTERAKRRGLRVFGSGRNWPVRSSAVEDLKLDPGYSSAFQMNNLVSACTALKSFECTVRANGNGRLDNWYRQVSESLLDHAATFKSVYMGDSDYYNGPLREPFRDTTSWTSLKMLQIPYSLLVGNNPRRRITDYLPPSLDNLVLYSTHKALARMETDIDSFVAETSDEIYQGYIEGTLPCLKGVELSLDWSFTADQTLEHRVPRPDVRHIVSAFQDHGVTFGVSMHSSYQSEPPPTKEDMQALNILFPGITSWCKGHKTLRLSTSAEPCVPGYKYMGSWGNGPYGWVWKHWDYGNDPESTIPE